MVVLQVTMSLLRTPQAMAQVQSPPSVASVSVSPKEVTLAPGDPAFRVRARLMDASGAPLENGAASVNWTIRSVENTPAGGDVALKLLDWIDPKLTTTVGVPVNSVFGRCPIEPGSGETCILVQVPPKAPTGFTVEIGASVLNADGTRARDAVRVRVIRAMPVGSPTVTATVLTSTPEPTLSPTP